MKKTLKLVLLAVLTLTLAFCAFTACSQNAVSGIELKAEKTNFVVGDEFSYDGLKVTAVYEDGTTKDVTGFNVDSSKVNKAAAGSYTITVTATVDGKDFQKTYTVTYAEGPHTHAYGEWKTVTAATCEVAGLEERECACGDKEQRPIAATGHTYGELVTEVAATCEVAGKHAHYECSACHKVFDTEKKETTADALAIAATGHTYGELVPEVAATCEVAGKHAHYECSACHKVFDAEKKETTADALVIAAKGHEYGTLVAEVKATCEVAGKHAYYECSACKKLFDADKKETTLENLAIAAKGHTYGELIPEVAATCAVKGTKAHFECSVCNKFFDEAKVETTAAALEIAIDPANHTYGELIAEVAATCAAKGTKAHYACACGKLFTAEKVETTATELEIAIDLAKHTYGELIAEVAATCTKEGTKAHYACACGKLFTAEKAETTAEELVIAKIDHDYQGVDKKCSMCGELDYASFEDVIKQGGGKTFKVVGKVVAIYGGNPYQGIFIANGDFGLQVYQATDATEKGIAIGDIIEVTGAYDWYPNNRTTQIIVEKLTKLTAAPDHGYTAPVDYVFDAATWATITQSETAADNVYTNRPITVTGVVKVLANNQQFSVTVGEGESAVDVIVFFKKQASIGDDMFAIISALKVGQTVTVSGVIGSYKGTTQIVAPSAITVKLTQEEQDRLTLEEAVKGLEGKYITADTVLPNTATWASDNPAVVITFDAESNQYKVTVTKGETEITVGLTATVGTASTTITMKVAAEGAVPAPTKSYVKLTEAPTDWTAATYIIVYEDGSGNAYVFNGTDVAKNNVKTTSADGVIEHSDDLAACEVSIDASCNIKVLGGTNKGKYIYGTSGKNALNFAEKPNGTTTITIAADGVATIANNSTTFKFNSASDQLRFRFYKSGQKSVCIYQLVEA